MEDLKTSLKVSNVPDKIKEYFIELLDKKNNLDDILDEYNEYMKSYNTWKNFKADFDNC